MEVMGCSAIKSSGIHNETVRAAGQVADELFDAL